MMQGPIGVFDSGYGGLSILRELYRTLPEYDFLYLGDNARSPYGNRSFEVIYQYTLEAVEHLFSQGCPLVILACNTASARALRNIQQKDLHRLGAGRRVLGIIRPVAEYLSLKDHGKIGIVATEGTVRSESYPIEIHKLDPTRQVAQKACPMWVPLVENHELSHDGCDFYVQRDLNTLFQAHPDIHHLVLACTHYPWLLEHIEKFTPDHVEIIEQGPIVAQSLKDYLFRHPEMEQCLSQTGQLRFQTSEDAQDFGEKALQLLGLDKIDVKSVRLGA